MIVAVVAIAAGTSIVLSILNAITRGIRRGDGDAPALVEVNDRIARIEQAVDAIAVEIERHGEQIRFTNKLLSGRPAESVSAIASPSERRPV